MSFCHFEGTLHSGTGLWKSNQRLELSYCNSIGRLLDLKLVSSHSLVNLNQKMFGLWSDFWVDLSGKAQIPKHRSMIEYLRSFLDFEGISIGAHVLVQRDDSLSNSHINSFSAVISHNKKDVKSRHQRRTQSDIWFEILGLVVSSHDRIHGCQNRATSIECSLNSSLGNRDGLLLHGLMNGHSVPFHHFVELIDATDSIVCKHKSTCL